MTDRLRWIVAGLVLVAVVVGLVLVVTHSSTDGTAADAERLLRAEPTAPTFQSVRCRPVRESPANPNTSGQFECAVVADPRNRGACEVELFRHRLEFFGCALRYPVAP